MCFIFTYYYFDIRVLVCPLVAVVVRLPGTALAVVTAFLLRFLYHSLPVGSIICRQHPYVACVPLVYYCVFFHCSSYGGNFVFRSYQYIVTSNTFHTSTMRSMLFATANARFRSLLLSIAYSVNNR